MCDPMTSLSLVIDHLHQIRVRKGPRVVHFPDSKVVAAVACVTGDNPLQYINNSLPPQ